jgi:hypothetical protein
MQSHKGDTSGKLEETERNLHEGAPTGLDLYLLGRIYSILGIRPRHIGLPGQAFCTACWDHWLRLYNLREFLLDGSSAMSR